MNATDARKKTYATLLESPRVKNILAKIEEAIQKGKFSCDYIYFDMIGGALTNEEFIYFMDLGYSINSIRAHHPYYFIEWRK